MPFTLIADRVRWVCDTCHDEQDYTGPDATEKARLGGIAHVNKHLRATGEA